MSYRLNLFTSDENGKAANRSFQLAESGVLADDQAAAGAIATAYSLLTDNKVSGATLTQSFKYAVSGFIATAVTPGARRWKVGRITAAVTPTADGVQTLATFEVPAIKPSLVTDGLIVDDGTISDFLDLFLATGQGRMSDGQAVSSNVIVGGYAFSKAHPASEDI